MCPLLPLSIKKDAQRLDWNFYVSARAAGLLSRSYEGMKRHINDALTDIGAHITEVSINRIDYAIDIATPESHVTHNRCLAHYLNL
jgi:hypothetical protein